MLKNYVLSQSRLIDVEHPSNVSEYWFLRYYRVLVVEEDGEKIVSVDVYKKGYDHEVVDENCLSSKEYCILYSEVDKNKYSSVFEKSIYDKIDKIVIVGVKARDRLETVNVRYVVKGDLTYNDIEQLFYASWRIIGCSAPRSEELP